MSTDAGSAALKDPDSPSVLARIKGFFGAAEESSRHDTRETAADSSTPSALAVLPALLAERDRVQSLALDEETRAKSLKEQLQE